MKNSDYWRKRAVQLEEALNVFSERAIADIGTSYAAAEKAIEEIISVWFQRLAKNNKVDLAAAKGLLDKNELAEFKWNVFEYIKYGQENALNSNWIKELENASAKFHIQRFEALKISVRQQFEVLGQKQLGSVAEMARNVYAESYYRQIYEVQKGFNLGFDVAAIDSKSLEAAISKPWATDGKTFSQRIWQNQQKAIAEIQTQLTQDVLLGRSGRESVEAISKKMNVSKNNAARLVNTEKAFIETQGQKAAFEELNVERYEIVATLDTKTSSICQGLDGKVFPMSEYEAGVTAPPFHPWCRSTTAPYFEDEKGFRAARDKDGNTVYVPSSMKYDEWKAKFAGGVDNSAESGIIEFGRSVGAKAYTDKVLLPDGSKGRIQEGSKITKVVAFAGKGTNKPIKVAQFLEKQYGVNASEWKKSRGDGYVDCPDGVTRHAELHWFESGETGRVKMKVKRWFDES